MICVLHIYIYIFSALYKLFSEWTATNQNLVEVVGNICYFGCLLLVVVFVVCCCLLLFIVISSCYQLLSDLT